MEYTCFLSYCIFSQKKVRIRELKKATGHGWCVGPCECSIAGPLPSYIFFFPHSYTSFPPSSSGWCTQFLPSFSKLFQNKSILRHQLSGKHLFYIFLFLSQLYFTKKNCLKSIFFKLSNFHYIYFIVTWQAKQIDIIIMQEMD